MLRLCPLFDYFYVQQERPFPPKVSISAKTMSLRQDKIFFICIFMSFRDIKRMILRPGNTRDCPDRYVRNLLKN